MFSVTLSDNFSFIPVSTTCYDDPTKDYSGRAASKIVLDNQTHVKETSLKLCDKLRSNLILKTGGTGINSDDITPETNTPLVEGQCVVINIGTKLSDTRRYAYVLFRGIGDDIQMGELVFTKE
ncbi:unnamed protein product, partial [Rotaria socialis]